MADPRRKKCNVRSVTRWAAATSKQSTHAAQSTVSLVLVFARTMRRRQRPGEPREGTFEAHLPRSWTLSGTAHGSFYCDSRFKPERLSTPSSNDCINFGKLSSEAVGMHSGIPPQVRPRPSSSVNIMLRNPAVRDGYVSSEPIGFHTKVLPRKTSIPSLRTKLPQVRARHFDCSSGVSLHALVRILPTRHGAEHPLSHSLSCTDAHRSCKGRAYLDDDTAHFGRDWQAPTCTNTR